MAVRRLDFLDQASRTARGTDSGHRIARHRDRGCWNWLRPAEETVDASLEVFKSGTRESQSVIRRRSGVLLSSIQAETTVLFGLGP